MWGQNLINSGVVESGICYRAKIHYTSYENKGYPTIKNLSLHKVDLQLKSSATTFRLVSQASLLCSWRSAMWFTHTGPIVDLAYVLTLRRHKNDLCDVHDVTGMVKGVITSIATSGKRFRSCLSLSSKNILKCFHWCIVSLSYMCEHTTV